MVNVEHTAESHEHDRYSVFIRLNHDSQRLSQTPLSVRVIWQFLSSRSMFAVFQEGAFNVSNTSGDGGETPHYDVLIIGAGQAAMPLIFALAKRGMTVALAERKYLGGSCVNFGCTPTKAVVASARVANFARRGKEFGIHIPTVEVDFPAVLAGAKAVVMESRNGLDDEFKDVENPTLLRGHARFAGRDESGCFLVQIEGGPLITVKQVVLDTGTRALIPPVEGLAEVPFITADSWLEHTTLPEHLILLGGGYIGLEMGQFYRRMGSRVTIVDRNEHIAEREDDDVCEVLQPILEKEGIKFHLSSVVTRVEKSDTGVRVTIQGSDKKETIIEGTDLFVATGRKPNTDDLGLETVGLKADEHGILTVDKHLRTDVEGIWAVGDIRGGPMFTHTSWDDHKIVLSAMFEDGSHTTDRLVPYAIFIDPQLGRVGMSESEARKSGKKIKVGRYEMYHNGRAREYRERPGFAKVVVDAETDKLLGATVVGDEAAETIHIYAALMNANAPVATIRNAVYVHPTYSEAIQSATEATETAD
jgi:pyruvate/2-oxoglutarate dehydrogenase complex dihydrolipoamide dehydrogenase (E3) component